MSETENLIKVATDARLCSRAPFSNFLVGAALRTTEGKIYTGCNIESASYGLTVCAERVAIWKALSECERDFTDLVVVVDTEQLTPPCGTCRQIIWEYCKEAKITLANLKGQNEVVDIRELLPKAFDARFLNENSGPQK
ncbi:MAG TPA: cytidine deaminase [Pyrinomonadaceae bacterium]|nr:cytidine deaminase [Pyrinomonadaceae bacterium]